MNVHALLLCFGICATGCLSAEIHLWTSLTGHSFEGQLVRIENQTVELRGRDGNVVSVPMDALNEESRALAYEVAGVQPLPDALFSYSSPQVDFEIRPLAGKGGMLHFQLKDRGRTLPHYDSLSVVLNLTEYRMDEERGKRRGYKQKIEGMIPEEEDSRNGIARYRIQYANGVEVIIEVRALSDGISFQNYIVDPDTYEHSQRLTAGLPFPVLLELNKEDKRYYGALAEKGATFEELKTMLDSYDMTCMDGKGNQTSFSFYESPKKMFGKQLSVSVPDTQKKIEIGVLETGSVSTKFYGGKKPIQGFGVNLQNGRNPDAAMTTFTFRLK